jgi:hypothetical protein
VRKQRAIPKSIVVFGMFLSLLVQPASAMGYSINYKNCAQLKAKYRFGVALSLKIAGDYPAKVSKSIYTSHIFLDFDLDGIVCEIELLQKNLNPNTQTTMTTATTPTTVVPIAPLPTSPQFLAWQNRGSVTLRSGGTYQIYVCALNANTTAYLDILSFKTGWTQKATGRAALDVARCPKPDRLFMWTFGWIVSEIPGEVSRMMLRGFTGVEEMMVVITN